jgi:LmbE family N-acetylglucosaminyl deacetylase
LIEGSGTPESQWRPWLAEQRWPRLDVDRLLAGDRPWVVLAAHPDDEVLAVGGLLRRVSAAGVRPALVWATDGEASHPGSTAITPAELRARRPAESAEALARLEVSYTGVRLGLPDGGVSDQLATLASELAAAVPAGAVLLAPWRGDGHPDHDACGHAAAAAAAQSAAVLLEYPIWAWHWARPADERVPWGVAECVALDPATVVAKQHAVDAFETQVRDCGPEPADAAVLPPAYLERFARADEVVFVTGAAR